MSVPALPDPFLPAALMPGMPSSRAAGAPSGAVRALAGGLCTSFLDAAYPSDGALRASLLVNDRISHRRVLDDLTAALESCGACAISVAFVTLGGIVPLIPAFDRLERRGVPVRILTCDYQRFTEPRAVRRLLQWKNIRLRFFRTEEAGGEGFHTKGYFFRQGDLCRFLIGSSNLTQAALTTSHEWNLSLLSSETGELAQRMTDEFEDLWRAPQAHPAEEVIDAYEQEYRQAGEAQRDMRKWLLERRGALQEAQAPVRPNAMQAAFVERVLAIRESGGRKALLISATGTGKTYAAAFAAAALAPRRMLFIVHREQIARQALESFRRVLGSVRPDGGRRTFGLLSGSERRLDADCVFATVQSTCLTLAGIDPAAFDLVIIDEAHHTGAKSYRTIMARLRPAFWLGLTGTPDRLDGFDVYGLFDHAVAGEIRLEEALEHDLLTPFHYFGLDALEVDGRPLDPEAFGRLGPDERWRQMLRQAEHYGWSGDRRRALVFVGTLDEARSAAAFLAACGHPAVALSGADDQSRREEAVERLEHGTGDERLEFIVTVDVFNEGVDIPSVNQVILMRETKSAVVFIQQLGRGLRRSPGKEFVVVLDFIGAWETNFLIAAALSGDRSGVKDRLRRFVAVGSRHLPGASTVHFADIPKQRIFRSIDAAKLSGMRVLRDAYRDLRFRLGRVPRLEDFEAGGSIDPVKFMTKAAGGSYHGFLRYCVKEKDYGVVLPETAETMLAWISQKLGAGLRPSEAVVLDEILQGHESLDRRLERRLREEWDFDPGEAAMARHLANVRAVLTNGFERTEDARRPWRECLFIDPEAPGGWGVSPRFQDLLGSLPEFRELVQELVSFILRRVRRRFTEHPSAGAGFLRLGDACTYEDAARLLDWSANVPAQNIGGYWYDREGGTFSIFVNYAKAGNAIQYHDRFLSPREILTLSKTNRRVDSPDARRMMKRGEYADTQVLLFLRRDKEDGESKAFYCLGGMTATGEPVPVALEVPDAGKGTKKVPAFEVTWRLEHAVTPDLYEYLTGRDA